MKIAYLDCFSGASGDMLLGCLLDAGLSLAELQSDLDRLDVGGYQLEAQRTTRQGLSGTHLRVLIETQERPARTLPAIERLLDGSDLAPWVKAQSLAVFRRLAQAEAAVHGTSADKIHFHEIGAVDSLIDIVGFVCALKRLQIDAVYSSPLPLGSGTIQTEHGRLPVPAPATLALLAQVNAPTLPGSAPTEMVTPTGAALLASFATFERPPMLVQAVGYGFGTKEFDWPNALRVWIGESLPATATSEEDQIVQLCCNLDDTTGEVLGHVMERLLAVGALDVWFTPIQMKKNRPACQVSVLARPQDAEALAALLLRETPTLGVRQQLLARYKAGRQVEQVDTSWGPVRVKVKYLQDRAVAFSPEYDDCRQIAAANDLPLAEVMAVVRQQAQALLADRQADHSS
jgi:uncharacterized protein (TIGR00299 family) protein